MLATGAFSPLDRFMSQTDYQRVLGEMRLTSGHIFPMPVTLPVEPDPATRLGQDLALRNAKNELLAVMTIEEIYDWDRDEVAQKVFGTQDLRHPLVAEMHRWGTLNISGRLQVLQLLKHYDFQDLRLTPAQTRARLETFDRRNVVAFQTRNPLHRVHEELTKRATRSDARNMVGQDCFVEVFVDTPLEVCEQRDTKGIYAKARRGEIKGFTGIDDPYEPPLHPEIKLDTVEHTPEENARLILNYLMQQGLVRDDTNAS